MHQDPDVLDTWFSSGLWPLSTLGWPEDTPELEKWNPSHTLCTAREIITLWVSRMVMFNLYFRDCLPFSEVFVHAMIQDGEGRKMSKSLGNGVDPLDIIDSHGSDAMRFTLALMTTQTQDVRMPVERDATSGKNTSPKFDIGRNFCNKLWNASRFALMNLESIPPLPPGEGRGEGSWSIIDRWIMSRAARTVQQVNEALETYRFDAYAKACYDFFWRDLCDWYIEAIKPAMKDPQRAPQTSHVLATALDISLRLMHPMIPFITEVLWWKLNEVRPQRGFTDAAEPHLIKAKFPLFDEKMQSLTSEGAEFVVGKLQELIGAIRTLRNEYKVDPKKSVKVSIRTPRETESQIHANREMIELLAVCELAEVGETVEAPATSSKTVAAGCEIFVEGLVDEAAEQQRIAKRREELTRQISAMKGRLANQGYLAKAPPHLVKQTQDQLAEAEAELAKLGS